MVAPFPVVADKQLIARTSTYDGRVVTVHKIRHTAPIRGMAGQGMDSYSVDIGGTDTDPATTVGFLSSDDAMHFLTDLGESEYQTVDSYGTAGKTSRQGLGIPAATIATLNAGSVPVGQAPSVRAVVPPDAAQHPREAAAFGAPSDAASWPHENMTGERAQQGAVVDAKLESGPTLTTPDAIGVTGPTGRTATESQATGATGTAESH